MKTFAQAIRSQGVSRRVGWLAIGTFVLGLLMSAFAVVSTLNVRNELTDAFAQLARLRDEQSSSRKVLGLVVDAETGLRGYALTGEPSYLEPYAAARSALGEARARYREARSQTPEHYAEFDAGLETSLKAIEGASRALEGARPDPVSVRTHIADIKVAVDILRHEQAALDEKLAAKLETRRAKANQTVSTLLFALSVLVLGLALLSFAQLRELAVQAARYLSSEREAANEIIGLEREVAHSRAEITLVNRQLGLTLRSAGVQVFSILLDGSIPWVADDRPRNAILNKAPQNLGALLCAPDDERARAALHAAIERGEEQDLEVRLQTPDQGTRWIKLHFAPPASKGDETALGCAFDITDLKQREENNFWLMRELSHRSKNLLAIVQSIARQTSRNATDKEVFLARFSTRLQALAAAHDLLVRSDYAGAQIGDLVRSQLIGLTHLIDKTITLEGPDLVIRAEAAQNLGMALHELASNAMTHGALREADGRLAVSWRIESTPGEPALVLDWVESASAGVSEAHPGGFGDTLIRMNLPRALEGEVSLVHAPEGTRCHMRLPLRRLRPDLAQPRA